MRFLIKQLAVVLAGGAIVLGTAPATANAQKALVYCPVTVDATGCTAIANALATAHPLGVDRGFDGTNGTVDLKTVDLFKYSVFVVPSLADDATAQPYAMLRDPEVVEHLKAALIGRIALWSGSPDQGATNRAMKDALIQNLVAYAGGAYATAKGPALVALLDASSNAASRYDWVRAVTPLPVMADPNLLIYNGVRALNQTGTSILTSGLGPIAYTNMATFGFQVPNGAAGVSLDAVGQTGIALGGQVVLVTMEGGNTGGATVMTDRLDYAPGELVTITGAGWEPGETVRMTLHEDPLVHEDRVLTSVADGNGNFTNTEFAPEEHHLGVRFVLTAIGETSGRRAQTTFTDNRTVQAVTVNGGLTVVVAPGESITLGVRVLTDNGGGNNDWESTSWRIATTVPPPTSCFDTPDHTASGTFIESFPVTAPAVPGTYNVYVRAHTGNACGAAQQSGLFTLANAVLVVGTPTIASISPAGKVYGDAAFTLTVNGTNFAPSSVVRFNGSDRTTAFVNTTQLTASITAADLLTAGAFPITVRNADNSVSNSVNLTVSPRPITVTADAKNKVYGNADPALTYQITSGSLVGSDAFSGALTRAAGENVGTYQIQQGTLALSSNYALTFVPANLTITQRPLTIAADPKSKLYGDVDPAFTYQLTSGSLVSGDNLSGALGRVAGENVGTYAILQNTLTAGTNYLITYVPANLTIDPRALTVTADPKAKIYGDADPAFTYQLTTGTLVSGDSFTGALGRVAGENVGTYAITQGTLTAGANYTITFVSADLTITARPITVTADAKSKVYGNADPTLTYQVTVGSLAFSDVFTGALARAAGENVGTYAITQGTLSAGTNYTLTFVGADLTITVRPITVTADPKSKVYGDADPALTYQVTSGSLAFTDAFGGALVRVPGENVGPYAIQQGTLALSANYDLTFVGANLTITARPITVAADAKSKVYGDADPAFTYQLTSGTLVGTDALTGALTRVSGENVGTYAIQQGTLTAGSNYNLTFVGADLSITTRPITVTADPQSKVYGNADPSFTYQVTVGSLVAGDAFTGALSRVAGENVGTYAIQLGTLTAGTNYTLTFVSADLTITARPITVTADPKSKVYGNADPALTYQITSGSLAFSDVFTGALTRVPGENVGTYAIQQGTLALSANYNLAYVGANLSITARPVTITADAKSKVYGDADPVLTYQITSGSLAFADAFGGALTRDAGENVGTYAITQGTVALNANYTLTFVGANLTITARPITVTADAKSKVYGDADPALTYQLTSGALVGADAFSGALARVAGENVGLYQIQQGTLTAGPNYELTFVPANLEITPRPITVTADAKTKVYGDADPALTYQVTSGNLVSGDAFSGALARAAGENVGTYALTQGTLTAGTNYTLTFVGANLTITVRPITVTADAKSKVYGDADPALTYQITSGSLAFSDAFTGALARVAGENVGTYAIQQGTLALNANYNLTFVPANLTITPRPITVTADPKTKVYGDADPALTYQITTGTLVDENDLTGALARAPGENVGNYAITQGTLAATTNYTLTFVPSTLVITQRPIAITADAKSKVYGNADPAFTYQLTTGNLVFSDAFSGSLTRVTGENVGTYAIEVGSVTAGPNYLLTFNSADLTITQRPITVTADPQTKVYGNADPALTYQITTGTLAFSDAFTGALERAAGENVGTYAITQGTLTAGGNYLLTYAGANLTITVRPITITADPKTKTYGDADPALTYQITSGSLAFSDAFAGALTRVAGEDVGSYAIQQGAVALSANYALTYVPANLSITPRAISVTADPKSKVYGEADPSLTYQITSGALVGSDAFSGALTRAAGEDVGSYAILQGTLALSTNYTLSYTGANLTITQRAITITADAKSKVYGDADPALTYQITSGTLVFGNTVSGSLTRAPGQDVGTYAILVGTVSAGPNYDVTYAGADLEITARPITVTADAQTKVYGDADPALTYQITTGNLAYSDAFTGALARVAGENVGSYAIEQATLTAGTNYTLTYVGANLSITQRPVTITADAKTKTYGDADPALTYQITSGSLAFSDAFAGSLTRAAGENVGSYAITQGTVALNANYALSYVGANLVITQRAITVTADVKTKVYGDPDPALTYQLTAGTLVGADAITGALTRAPGQNVGLYALQQGTVTAGANYNLTYVGANLEITKRALTVTADDKTKIAGAVNPTLTGVINGIQYSDPITATYSTTAVTLSVPGTYPITPAFTVVPALANYTTAVVNGTLTVTANAAPVLGTISAPVLPTALGTAVNVSVPFTDVNVPASQPYTATIDWGNGTTSTSSFTNGGTITGSKNYPAAGVYTITITVKQDNFPTTHFDTKTFEYYVVVYDPNGGFVTGGGWINSPVGAYLANPSLTGKANFGFVSKYKKGQSTPDGNTEFQFHAAGMNFKSSVYEWLVVAGARAQFKGTGTINGAGSYGFMLTAIDGQIGGGGGTDKFRIKIWDIASGDTVYDNQVTSDTSDAATPTTTLGGGSINIQAK